MRGSSSKGELGAERERAMADRPEAERRAAEEAANEASADAALDMAESWGEERSSASAGNLDADCVGESRPAKTKTERKRHIGPRTKKEAAEDDACCDDEV